MVNTKMFIAKDYPLSVFNGQPMIDVAIRFFTTDNCDGEEIDWDFPNYAGAFLRVFNERLGRELKEFTLSRDGAYLVANVSASDMTFEDNGNYYYEVVYLNGVYEQVIRYGRFTVI
ncbi:MAG TPA: hypothetical protein VGK59_11635 [Ohtaekwangia sp.]